MQSKEISPIILPVSMKGTIVQLKCWLTNAKFSRDGQPAHLAATRQIATLLMNNNSNLHSQWISGISNVVANCLSRDFDCPDILLTKKYSIYCPLRCPRHSRLLHFPKRSDLG